MFGVLAIFLVPCGLLSNKIGKAKTYAVGLAIASVALIIGFFLPNGPGITIYILAAIVGLGFSAQWVCPHSMMPDVIEYDEELEKLNVYKKKLIIFANNLEKCYNDV